MDEAKQPFGESQEQEAQRARSVLAIIYHDLQDAARDVRRWESVNGALTDKVLVGEVFSGHAVIVALGRQELARRRMVKIQNRFLRECADYAVRFGEPIEQDSCPCTDAEWLKLLARYAVV